MGRLMITLLALMFLSFGRAQEGIEMVLTPWDFLDSPRPIFDEESPGVSWC